MQTKPTGTIVVLFHKISTFLWTSVLYVWCCSIVQGWAQVSAGGLKQS